MTDVADALDKISPAPDPSCAADEKQDKHGSISTTTVDDDMQTRDTFSPIP